MGNLMRKICTTSTCSVALKHTQCDDRLCLQADIRLYAPADIQSANARSLCNALQCVADIKNDNGDVTYPGGLAILVRSTSCVSAGCQYDTTGVMALEAGLSFFVPLERDRTATRAEGLCWPGDQGIQCVPSSAARHGGIAFIVHKSDSIDLRVKENPLCSTPYKQIVADIIVADCPTNALSVTELGHGVLAKNTNCWAFTVEVDNASCLPVPTRTLKLSPTIANDQRNAYTCVGAGLSSEGTYGGMAVLARDTSCIELRVVDDGFTRWLEAYPIICPTPDNAFDCTASGMSICFGATCTLALNVESSAAGCGALRVVRGYVVIAPDQGAAVNLGSQSGGGLAAMIRPSSCITVDVAEEASGGGDDGCGGSPRVIQLSPIICESADNMIECGPNGLGAYIDDACVIKLLVDDEASPGCANTKVIKAYIYKALDFGGTKTDPDYKFNATVQTDKGLSTFIQPSDCIRPVIVQEASGYDDDGCEGKPRIVEFQWVLADDDANALVQTDAGLAAFVSSIDQATGLKSCVNLGVQSFEANGITSRAIIAQLVIDTYLPANKQALRCGAGGEVNNTQVNGAHVLTEDTNEFMARTNVVTGAISLTPSFSSVIGNALHCRTGCGASGMAVVFRDFFGCTYPNIGFALPLSPCGGGVDVIAQVVVSPTSPDGYPKASSDFSSITYSPGSANISNGLQTRRDGLWAPPTTNGDTGHVGYSTAQTLSKGNETGHTIMLPLVSAGADYPACNPSDCREAMGFVVVRAPSCVVRVQPDPGVTLSVTIQYSGSVGTTATSVGYTAQYGGLSVPEGISPDGWVSWAGPFEMRISGQTEVFAVDAIKPGQCIVCDLTPSVVVSSGNAQIGQGIATAEFQSYSIDAWVFSILSPDDVVFDNSAAITVAASAAAARAAAAEAKFFGSDLRDPLAVAAAAFSAGAGNGLQVVGQGSGASNSTPAVSTRPLASPSFSTQVLQAAQASGISTTYLQQLISQSAQSAGINSNFTYPAQSAASLASSRAAQQQAIALQQQLIKAYTELAAAQRASAKATAEATKAANSRRTDGR